MAEERVTTAPSDSPTVVISDRGGSSGGSWLIGIVLLVGLIAGIYFFTQMSHTQTAKDTAITKAANDVGSAANQVGNAAENAADQMKSK